MIYGGLEGEFYSPPPEFQLLKQMKKDIKSLTEALKKLEYKQQQLESELISLQLQLRTITYFLSALYPSFEENNKIKEMETEKT